MSTEKNEILVESLNFEEPPSKKKKHMGEKQKLIKKIREVSVDRRDC